MTEIEVPIEKVQEDIHHQAIHGNDSMISKAALMSAILAVMAAITALFAGHYSNEALLKQIEASDQWSYFQAKGIKASIAELKLSFNKEESTNAKSPEDYKKEQEKIKEEAETLQKASAQFLHKHEALASTVTLFQIAIAITAIAVLTRKKHFLNFSLVLGILGFISMIRGFIG